MFRLIQIECLNNGIRKEYPIGTTLTEVADDLKITLPYPILGARVNNEIEEMMYGVFKAKTIEFFDITDQDGMRMYVRSLFFVLMKAVKDLFPETHLRIEHSISRGYYCEIDDLPANCRGENDSILPEIIENIKNRMREIVDEDLPFVRKEIKVSEAIELFRANRFHEKALLFSTCPEYYTQIYYLDGQVDYFYGYLVPSTRFIQVFDLLGYFEGMLLRLPQRKEPEKLEEYLTQNKLFSIFEEHKDWAKILGISTVGRLNDAIQKKGESELIKIAEALHEKKVIEIADKILHKKDKIKLVLIAGPSSSGKTTFCKRLAIQLKVGGLNPVQISMDNYFVDREKTPLDEQGQYDFEAFEAVDIQEFIHNFEELKAGNAVKMPVFDFGKGKKTYPNPSFQMHGNDILLVEGIHALNPKLTGLLEKGSIFKVYISALTQIVIDGHNRIPTTDNRLIRRMIRDYKYRGYSALDTLRRWPSVRRGEDRNIFPYQEEADVMFNSALIYELGVLKTYIEPLLKEVAPVEPEFSEAQRLLKFVSYFKPIPDKEIPPTSILREFLEGSTFKYD